MSHTVRTVDFTPESPDVAHVDDRATRNVLLFGGLLALLATVGVETGVLHPGQRPHVTDGHVRFAPSPDEGPVKVIVGDQMHPHDRTSSDIAHNYAYSPANVSQLQHEAQAQQRDGYLYPNQQVTLDPRYIEQRPAPTTTATQKP